MKIDMKARLARARKAFAAGVGAAVAALAAGGDLTDRGTWAVAAGLGAATAVATYLTGNRLGVNELRRALDKAEQERRV